MVHEFKKIQQKNALGHFQILEFRWIWMEPFVELPIWPASTPRCPASLFASCHMLAYHSI